MKTKWLLVFLIFSSCNAYPQESTNSRFDLKLRYDSAKSQFESFESIHGGFIQTPNVKMHYLHWGNSKDIPLIWIHGSFTNAYELGGIADEIVRKGYYLIAIDYYGHGLTRIPRHDVSLYHVADDIKALMDAKRINRAVIGGWSRGGMIATAFYDSYPEKVLGLILEDGGSVSTNSHYHKISEMHLRERVAKIFSQKVSYSKYENQFEAYKANYDFNEGGTQFTLLAWISIDEDSLWSIGPGIEALFNMENEEEFLDTILRPTKTSLFAASASMLMPKTIYRNLSVPMLILDPIADDDLFPYERENEDLARQHADLIVYKRYSNTGHNIHYERPEMFVEDVARFLKTVEAHWKR